MKTIKITLCATLIISGTLLGAQKIRFAYDDAGNRIKRELVIAQKAVYNEDADNKDKSFYDALGRCTVKISHTPAGIISINFLDLGKDDKATIDVYSIGGLQIYSQECDDYSATVDISGQAPGVYILRVEVNGEQTTWKITKQ